MRKFNTLFLTVAWLFLTSIGTFAELSDIVDIHGFVSQGFLMSKGNTFLADNSLDGSLEMRELGINFQKEIGSRIRVGMQILSRDVGVYGNNKVVIDWAYGEVRLHDMLSISAGRLKNQLGFYTDIQDFDFLTPWAILPSYLYDKGLRSLSASADGFKASGSIDLKKAGGIDYSLTYGTIDLGKETDIIEYGNMLGADLSNTSVKNIIISRLMYNTPLDGLRFNVSHFYLNNLEYKDVPQGTNPINGNLITADVNQDMNWFFAGAQYSHSYFDVVFEYHLRASKGETSIFNHPLAGNFTQPADTFSRQGGYLGLNFKPIDWFNFGGYYQMYWEDTHLTDNELEDVNDIDNISNDAAITTTFNILGSFTIKLEGHFVKGTALVAETQNPDGFKDKWQYAVAKLTYNF
jgi:hypothetical protein